MAIRQEITVRNAAYQVLDALRRNRRKRQKSGLFFVEGVRNINAAIQQNWTLDAVIYPRGQKLSHWADSVLSTPGIKTIYAMAPELVAELSGKDEPSELLAIVAMRPDVADLSTIGNQALIVVLDRPSNKGNLGTIIRSCEAIGTDLLVISGHSIDLYDPEVITAGMGSFFSLPIIRLPGGEPLNQWLEQCRLLTGASIIGTSAHGTLPPEQIDMSGPMVLLIGNETDGLSAALQEGCDVLARIPFAPGCTATSLNIACATTVFLYEAGRQRRI